jgi:hypothetical protein
MTAAKATVSKAPVAFPKISRTTAATPKSAIQPATSDRVAPTGCIVAARQRIGKCRSRASSSCFGVSSAVSAPNAEVEGR